MYLDTVVVPIDTVLDDRVLIKNNRKVLFKHKRTHSVNVKTPVHKSQLCEKWSNTFPTGDKMDDFDQFYNFAATKTINDAAHWPIQYKYAWDRLCDNF